jgi:positive regulator of sigma E activity
MESKHGSCGGRDMKMRSGVVTDIGKNGWAAVALNRSESCQECGETHCCGSLGPGQTMIMKARNPVTARKGDLVQLDYTTGEALKGASIYYVFIMAGLVLGAVLGAQLDQTIGLGATNAAILFSVLGALLGLTLAGLLQKRKRGPASYAPAIRRIIRRGVRDNNSPLQTAKGSPKCPCAV